MAKRATLIKLSLLIVEFTSIPLLVLASIYLLSGYQMLNPEAKIIPEPRIIHTDSFLRILAIFLLYLHVFGGVTIMIERHLKGSLKKIAEIAVIAVITAQLILFLIIEATL